MKYFLILFLILIESSWAMPENRSFLIRGKISKVSGKLVYVKTSYSKHPVVVPRSLFKGKVLAAKKTIKFYASKSDFDKAKNILIDQRKGSRK